MKSENNNAVQKDQIEIDEIANQFFDLFTNTDNRIPNLRDIHKIFLSDGLIINNSSEEPAIYDVESFMQPRVKILTDGTLANFKEQEVDHQTEICGNIAQRKCSYIKSGVMNGEHFEGEGMKLMQLIKVRDKWALSAVIWNDKK